MKLVYILWDDTAYPDTCSWRTPEEVILLMKQDTTIESVGWILKKTKKYILLTSRVTSGDGKIAHVDKIPRSAILKMKKLK